MEPRAKAYFSERSTHEMSRHIRPKERTLREKLAYACRIIAANGHEAGLAGQISARSETRGAKWTLRFGLGFEEATPDDFIEVDGDLETIGGSGMANPATRFHLAVYEARPDVQAMIHTHSPYISALAASRTPLAILHMDMTPFFEDCAFLKDWPGVPIADQEGAIISAALGNKRSIILAHHGQLAAGSSIEEATYLAVYLERAARIQIRARVLNDLQEVPAELAREAHDYLLQPSIVNGTFDYWCRQIDQQQAPNDLSHAFEPAGSNGKSMPHH